jgi:hypothetical protein
MYPGGASPETPDTPKTLPWGGGVLPSESSCLSLPGCVARDAALAFRLSEGIV